MKGVNVTIQIAVSPESIIRAFVDPSILREWWGVNQALIECKTGGVYIICWKTNIKYFEYVLGAISEYHPSYKLLIKNLVYLSPEREILGPMMLMIRVRKLNNLSQIYLSLDGYKEGDEWDWYYEAVKDARPKQLHELKDYLESQ